MHSIKTRTNKNPIFTERQREVLILIANGYTNREIANILYITDHTVKAHLCSIFEILSVTSRLQAVVKSLKLGLISLSEIDI